MDKSPFLISLAEVIIQIYPQYDYLREFCARYECTGTPQVVIRTTPEDIALEQQNADRENALEGLPAQQFSKEYLETLAVYRKIALALLEHRVILFHGSCIAVDGQAYLFTAKSGTGKSTHVRLWRKRFAERAVMVNDDKPLLRITEDGVIAYGTPWNGKHNLSNNIAVPLKAICILERSAENRICRQQPAKCYPLLLQQTYRPREAAAMEQTLQLFDRMLSRVAIYRLGCNMEPEAAEVSYKGMNPEGADAG